MAKPRFPTPPPPKWHSERVRPVASKREAIEAEMEDARIYTIVKMVKYYKRSFPRHMRHDGSWSASGWDGVVLYEDRDEALRACPTDARVRPWWGRPCPGMVVRQRGK